LIAVISFGVFTFLVGTWKFSRIDPEWGSFGLLNEGSALLLLAWAAIVLPYIVHGRRRRPLNGPVRTWLAAMSLLHIYIVASAIWAPTTPSAMSRIIQLLLLCVVLLGLALAVHSQFSLATGLALNLFYFIGSAFAVVGIATMPLGFWLGGGARMAILWGGPNAFVRIVATAGLIAVYKAYRSRRVLWLLPLPACAFAAFMSGSRSGLIAFTIAAVPFARLFVSLFVRRVATVITGVTVLLVVSYTLSAPLSPMRDFADRMWTDRFVRYTIVDQNLSQRDVVFRQALDLFSTHPLIGVGFNGYTVHLQNDTGFIQPYSHNFLLDLACEAGALGLLLFSVCVALIVARTTRPTTVEQRVCFYLAIGHFLVNMMSGSYYDARFMWLFLFFYMLPAETQHSGLPTRRPARVR
jgi:O-antigen ligase